MARKKKDNQAAMVAASKRSPTPVNQPKPSPGNGATSSGSPLAERLKKSGVTRFTLLGMSWGGAFLGILSGLNQWPQQPVELTTPAAGAAWMGAILGLQRLDWNAASQGGFLGLVVGLGFALSFAMPERKMLNIWLLGGCGLFVGGTLFHTATGMAGGWILGFMLALAAPPKVE